MEAAARAVGADGRVQALLSLQGTQFGASTVSRSPGTCRIGQASGSLTVKEDHEAQQFAFVQLMTSVSGSSRVDGGVRVKSLSQKDVFRAICPGSIHGRVHRYEVCY